MWSQLLCVSWWLLTELFDLVEVPVTLTGHLDTVITKSVKEIRSICSVQGKHHCLLVPAWKRARMRQKQWMMKFNYEILHITTDRLSISVMLIISIFFFSVWTPNSSSGQLVFFIVPPSTVRLVIIVGCYLYTICIVHSLTYLFVLVGAVPCCRFISGCYDGGVMVFLLFYFMYVWPSSAFFHAVVLSVRCFEVFFFQFRGSFWFSFQSR